MHFARLLRAAGLRTADRVIDCVKALEIAGAAPGRMVLDHVGGAALQAEQRPIFAQAFQIFWRDPKLAEA